MKLYFHPLSGSSRRVLLVVRHLDVQLETIVVDLTTGEQRAPAHVRRNPNGRLPVLEDGATLLWESRAIMAYLAEKTPGQTLYPTGADAFPARADVNRWLFWCAAHMSPAATVLVTENFVKSLTGRAVDPSELARGTALFDEHTAVLDGHLADRTWLCLDRVTLADLSLAACFALAGPAKLPLDERPHLRTWLGRVQELAAWRETTPALPGR